MFSIWCMKLLVSVVGLAEGRAKVWLSKAGLSDLNEEVNDKHARACNLSVKMRQQSTREMPHLYSCLVQFFTLLVGYLVALWRVQWL